MKKRIVSLILTFSLLLTVSAVLSGCESKGPKEVLDNITSRFNQPDRYVEGIRTAVQSEYGVTYGAAFDHFFTDSAWESFVTNDDINVVEFSGSCMFRDVRVSALIQFTIQEDGQHFQTTYLSLNGIVQTEEMIQFLYADVFDAYLQSGQ